MNGNSVRRLSYESRRQVIRASRLGQTRSQITDEAGHSYKRASNTLRRYEEAGMQGLHSASWRPIGSLLE